jgi:hypothetical protein
MLLTNCWDGSYHFLPWLFYLVQDRRFACGIESMDQDLAWLAFGEINSRGRQVVSHNQLVTTHTRKGGSENVRHTPPKEIVAGFETWFWLVRALKSRVVFLVSILP